MANNSSRTKVITGTGTRLSYFHGWEPVSINGGAEKYSVSVLIPKTDTETVSAINAAIDAAIEEGVAKFGGKKPNKAAIKLPLRDGDVERDDEAYKGHWFINANSTTAPQIVDRQVKPILDRSEVYSGCYARVSLNFFAFNSNGNKGIACGLGNIQHWASGVPPSWWTASPSRPLPSLSAATAARAMRPWAGSWASCWRRRSRRSWWSWEGPWPPAVWATRPGARRSPTHWSVWPRCIWPE